MSRTGIYKDALLRGVAADLPNPATFRADPFTNTIFYASDTDTAYLFDAATPKWVALGGSGGGGGGGGFTPGAAPTIVQVGTGCRGNGNTTLAAGATAGNMLILLGAGNSLNAAPAGFKPVAYSTVNGNQQLIVHMKVAAGGETTFGVGSGDNGLWLIYEVSGFHGFEVTGVPDPAKDPYGLFLSAPKVLGVRHLFLVTHDNSDNFTPDAQTGVVIDFNPNAGGNHTGFFGHTAVDFGGFLTGMCGGSTLNFMGVMIW